MGPIDILINNAGSLTIGAVSEFDPRNADTMFALNLLSPIRLIQTALPGMLARGRGVIVNVTSVGGVVSPPGWAYQGASKAGMIMFSETLRAEVGDKGVHVLTVYPGVTDTAMTRNGMKEYGDNKMVGLMPMGNPAEFAKRVRVAVEKRKKRLFYPAYYQATSWIPGLSRWFAEKFTAMPQTAAPNRPPESKV